MGVLALGAAPADAPTFDRRAPRHVGHHPGARPGSACTTGRAVPLP